MQYIRHVPCKTNDHLKKNPSCRQPFSSIIKWQQHHNSFIINFHMRASVNKKKKKCASVRECCVVTSVKNFFQERNLHPRTSFAFHRYNPNLWWYSISWILPADLSEIFLPLWRFSLYFDYLKNPIRNIWEGEAIGGKCFNFLISKNRFSFLLITWSEKCIAQTKTCLNS